MLTGKIRADRRFAPDDLRHNDPRFSIENRLRVAAALDRVQPIAERHSLSRAQLAIAWTIAQPGVTHALVGARNAEQARENARAALGPEQSIEESIVIARAFEAYAGGGAA